eukprot:357066-Chlamydomonas_euryale.AAC.5
MARTLLGLACRRAGRGRCCRGRRGTAGARWRSTRRRRGRRGLGSRGDAARYGRRRHLAITTLLAGILCIQARGSAAACARLRHRRLHRLGHICDGSRPGGARPDPGARARGALRHLVRQHDGVAGAAPASRAPAMRQRAAWRWSAVRARPGRSMRRDVPPSPPP